MADVYEAWQLWLERDVIKHSCFSFLVCSLVFKLYAFKVAPITQLWGKICRFSPLKMQQIEIGAPLICVINYTAFGHSGKGPMGVFFSLKD